MNAVAVKAVGGRRDDDFDSYDDLNMLALNAKDNPEALRALMNHSSYRAAVRMKCRERCKRTEWLDADDLEQEFFEIFKHSIRTFEGKSSLLTWTTVVIRNLYLDHVRRKKVGEQKVCELGWKEETIDSQAREASFWEAYESLTEQQKEMLDMKSHGARYESIAIALDIRTREGKPNVKKVCEELNTVRRKLDDAIRGW